MEGQRETRLYDAALGGDVPSLLELLRDDPLILDRCIIEKSCRFVQSPLHVATNHGHLEFIKEILCHKAELAEELDQSKRWSPLHIASAKGHLEILKELLAVNSSMCFVRDQDGRNVIHVAAMNGQIQVLGVLLRAKPQAARERTTDGETVLHLCVKHVSHRLLCSWYELWVMLSFLTPRIVMVILSYTYQSQLNITSPLSSYSRTRGWRKMQSTPMA
ncbi:ankyrin repeat-containing protein ITN1 [Beta vulgaris subsp. vulgaris]|uniref:ankyrin repeat-containing protein ITN1 n=1 Tax=Beta vulgaris subsp. vulgaris TaxID=3555 RepID=UPI0025494BFB|nr:ankyrin repeat-containing protein ITN1 [Beta vulgaris subsp. vulgaris]